MKSVIIKNAKIVNAESTIDSDILITDGVICSIQSNIATTAETEIIDAAGKYVLPGGIDVHTHFDLPTPAGNSCDDFYNGSKAAIAGGTTTIIDFVTPAKDESLIKALNERKNIAQNSIIDYGLHMGVTHWNNTTAKEIEQCITQEGVTSFKVYLAYKNTVGIDDKEFINVLETVGKLGGLVTIHCEHGDLISKLQQQFVASNLTSPKYHCLSHPAELEAEAINRSIVLANAMHCPIYIVHVSAKESVDIIRKAKTKGTKIWAETCPQYLFLDDSKYETNDFSAAAYVMSPPLRKKADQDALWEGIKDGIIDVVATDHCPFHLRKQKIAGINDFTKIPNGAGGVEHRLSLVYQGGIIEKRLNINQFVAITAAQPAKIFGIYPQKGVIAIGSDADLVIWDSEKEKIISAKTHYSRCDSNIFEGIKIHGLPELVMVGGEVVYKNNNFAEIKQQGKFLKRKKFDLIN